MKYGSAMYSVDDSTVSQSEDSDASSGASQSSSTDSPAHRPHELLDAAFHVPKMNSHVQSGGSAQQRQPASTASAAANGRQRATSLMAPNEMPQRLTKNYKELARDFRMLKPFTRLPDGTYPLNTRCVFCEIGSPKTVFFPCQHKCVCDICIKLHDISSDHTRSAAWGACPVCMTDIRLMLPHSGKEEDEYWKWISEVKPSLPSSFKHEFKDAAKKLRKNVVVPGGPPTPAVADTPSRLEQLQKQPSSRRHTWSASHGPQAPGHAGVDPKNCSIL